MASGRVYRPASFLKFTIRLEDFTGAIDKGAQDETKPFKAQEQIVKDRMNGINGQIAFERAALCAGGSIDTSYLRKLETTLDLDKKILGNVQKAKSIADKYSVEFFIVPLTLDVEINGFRMADTLKATFPFRDCPLDARIIRECEVECFLGTVKDEDFATKENWVLPLTGPSTVFRFKGYVDQWEAPHSEEGSTISITARSYEAVLIDGKIAAAARAYRPKASEEYISTYVNRILDLYPPTSGEHGDPFRAVWWGDPDKEPKLNRRTLLRSLQSPKGRNVSNGAQPGQEPDPVAQPENTDQNAAQGEGAAPGGMPMSPGKGMSDEGTSIWDLITQACELAGCLPLYDPSLPNQDVVVDGKDVNIKTSEWLLLTPAQTMFEKGSPYQIQGGANDGFQRQFRDDNGNLVKSDLRVMVWGQNIKSVKFSRKLGRVRANGVEVRCYNPDGPMKERTLVARFPSKKDLVAMRMKAKGETRQGVKGVKGGGKLDTINTVVMAGIRDQTMLDQIAVNLYHQMSRQELAVELETDDLASYMDPSVTAKDSSTPGAPPVKAHNDDPDILHLTSGSPVRVMVARQVNDPSYGENITISTLSEVFDKRGNQIADLIRSQQGRFGRMGLSPEKLDEFATKVQNCYRTAKLQDIFYCRAVTHSFNEEGYSAKMELVNYMEVRGDPDNLSDETKKMNESRKRKKKKKDPKKGSQEAKAKQAAATQEAAASAVNQSVVPNATPAAPVNPTGTGRETGTGI